VSAPNLPVFAAAVDAIFAARIAYLQNLRAKAEAALPGSGAYFDQAIADTQAARAAVDPSVLAQIAVSELGGLLGGTAPIVGDRTDLAR
jgi:hypothetical protein